MDIVKTMETFVRVVRGGSFAAAADQLSVSRAIVTKHIMQLEQRLKTRLLNRTTRRLSTTDIGKEYFDFCLRILGDLKEQEAAIARLQQEPVGALKVLAPKSFGGLHLMSAMLDFKRLYRDIEITLILNDVSIRTTELLENGFDMAIHTTKQRDSSLMSRRLGTARSVICAAPAYVEKFGMPQTPRDLARHSCLLHAKTTDGIWRFRGKQGRQAIKVDGSIRANSIVALRDACLAGFGIGNLPTYGVGPDIREGRLVRLLPAHPPPDEAIQVVFPHRDLIPVKARLFIDFLAKRFHEPPWEP